MSLLSQFFPSGGGGQRVQFLLVGGGGGGGAAGCYISPGRQGYTGAGGGGGQVVVGEDYEVVPGLSYPIVVGAGGAGGCMYPHQPSPYILGGWGLPGTTGGNSCFGSVIAGGGGGGAGGFDPTASFPTISGLVGGEGCPGGTGGGGSAATASSSILCNGGTATSTYPVGNTVKFGSPGTAANNHYTEGQGIIGASPCGPTAPYVLSAQITWAGGGGGNTAGGAVGGGSISLSAGQARGLPCSLATQPPYTPNCWNTIAYTNFSGALSSTGGTPSNAKKGGIWNTIGQFGADGITSDITGTTEYYGGGGMASMDQARVPYYANYNRMAPTHPYFPSSSCPRWRTPGAGLGGGGYVMVTAAYYQTNNPPWQTPAGVYGGRMNSVCYPCIVLCGACSGLGGGGVGAVARGYVNTTTGPCASNPAVRDGQSGGSGVFILRYPTNFAAATVSGNTPITPVPGFYIYKWTGPGSVTFN